MFDIGFHFGNKDDPTTNVCQIFVSGPMNTHFNNIDPTKYVGKKVYVHSSYISKLTDSHKIEEMKRTMEINGIGIVVHYGKITLDVMKKQLIIVRDEMIRNNITCKLILEMKAVKSDIDTHETPEKFNLLMSLLDDIDPDHKFFAICFDTSHFHSAGIKLTSFKDCENYFNKINHSRIILFHLNGNTNKLGSGRDQHNVVGDYQDEIWSRDKSGLSFIINFAKKNKIDIILERHDNLESEIAYLQTL
jgi:endonuclease IV